MTASAKGDVLLLAGVDNVAVALRPLEPGESVIVEQARLRVVRAVPAGHKIAVKSIGRGEHILKYGQVMGRATETIAAGDHVHVHNVEGIRGRGDLAPERPR